MDLSAAESGRLHPLRWDNATLIRFVYWADTTKVIRHFCGDLRWQITLRPFTLSDSTLWWVKTACPHFHLAAHNLSSPYYEAFQSARFHQSLLSPQQLTDGPTEQKRLLILTLGWAAQMREERLLMDCFRCFHIFLSSYRAHCPYASSSRCEVKECSVKWEGNLFRLLA